jgi:hypothetical protein
MVEEERRRESFKRWLLRVWDWAEDEGRPVALDIAEIVSHADEPDYPMWSVARKRGVIGDGKLADLIRSKFGLPVMAERPTQWEREINYQPLIYLDEKVWDSIYNSLGWVNRDLDKEKPDTFWLWSNAANQIRFAKRKRERVVDEQL